MFKNFDDFARRANARRSNLIEFETASSQKHAPRGILADFVGAALERGEK
jgi:hypothetical protein